MLSTLGIKAICIGIVMAAIGGLIWREHYLVHKLKARDAELATANATIEQQAKNAAQLQADNKLNQVTSHALQERLTAIESERRADPLPGLRCHASVSIAVAQSGTATGSDGSQPGREPQETEVDFDPTPAIDQFGTDCAVIAERLASLQAWERNRAH